MYFCNLSKKSEPDKMQHYAAFHLGLHCLPKYPFRGLNSTKGEDGYDLHYCLIAPYDLLDMIISISNMTGNGQPHRRIK